MGFKVYVNIYDLTCLNFALSKVGLGIYHSGVQIGRSEFCFVSSHERKSGIREI